MFRSVMKEADRDIAMECQPRHFLIVQVIEARDINAARTETSSSLIKACLVSSVGYEIRGESFILPVAQGSLAPAWEGSFVFGTIL
jgi:hypothetical protein